LDCITLDCLVIPSTVAGADADDANAPQYTVLALNRLLMLDDDVDGRVARTSSRDDEEAVAFRIVGYEMLVLALVVSSVLNETLKALTRNVLAPVQDALKYGLIT
jgi:hypothetical protein